MPFTLLHYSVAYGLHKMDGRLPLPALAVGSVIPDIEVPILAIFFTGIIPDHFILHSLIGGLTLGVLGAVLTTRFIFPPVMSLLFGIEKERLVAECSISAEMILSCVIGVLGHILLDYPMHWYNAMLWPWIEPTSLIGPLVLFFSSVGDVSGIAFTLANGTANLLMFLIFVYVIASEWDNRWESIWLGGDQ
ncbi:MAG: DUF4184 family protein [Candidatus Thorarchaeota archaeon]